MVIPNHHEWIQQHSEHLFFEPSGMRSDTMRCPYTGSFCYKEKCMLWETQCSKLKEEQKIKLITPLITPSP